MKSLKQHATPKKQAEAFIEAAKAAEADTDESRWEARLKAVAQAVAPAPVKSVRKALKKSRK